MWFHYSVSCVACASVAVWLVSAGMNRDAFAATSSQQCEDRPGRADYERAWDEVLSDKKMFLEGAVRDLQTIKDNLRQERASDIGAAGSGKEVEVAILLVTQETTDLISRVTSFFNPKAGPVQTAALKALKKGNEKLRKAKEEADRSVDLSSKDIIDVLPTFLPGINLARQTRDWQKAQREFAVQIAGIDRTIRQIETRLSTLGSRDRSYSIDAILQKSSLRSRQCVDPSLVIETPKQHLKSDTEVFSQSRGGSKPGGTAPIQGACSITGTC
jgi:hypothetical protein